jgi:hypothetical protein
VTVKFYYFYVKEFRDFFTIIYMIVEDSEKSQKIPKKFECLFCDYFTCSYKDFEKHVATDKHKKRGYGSKMVVNGSEKSQKSQICKKFACECGKSYKFDTGLYRHKNKCHIETSAKQTAIPDTSIHNAINVTDKELMMTILKENSELKNMVIETQHKMLEIMQTGTHNVNSHNKTFNLQFFLNDTCKDAMNINDFVNNIKLQLSDLETMGEIGYVNGISNIIVRNLKDMDVASRPIHCTDIKREVMYIKDEDKWDKDLNGNPKVRNVIKHIAHKNSKLLNEFKAKNPDYNNSSSKVSDKYNKLLIETMGGKGDNDLEKENKIIRNITKEIIVEKE